MTTVSSQLSDNVRAQIASALGMDTDEVQPESSLVNDLGAESLDLLDMLFRIEKKVGVKIAMADITGKLQGTLSDEEFVQNGVVTRAGLEQLHSALPQINVDELEGNLESSSIFSLFTVQNLIDMVAERAS